MMMWAPQPAAGAAPAPYFYYPVFPPRQVMMWTPFHMPPAPAPAALPLPPRRKIELATETEVEKEKKAPEEEEQEQSPLAVTFKRSAGPDPTYSVVSKRVRFEEDESQAVASLLGLARAPVTPRDVDLPDPEEIGRELRVLNATIWLRVEPRPGCPCKSETRPCRKCLVWKGYEDLKRVLRNTKQGNNVFESWLDLQCFCEMQPQKEMLGVISEILEKYPHTRDGVRRFANEAVKLVDQPVVVMNCNAWVEHGINLGVCQVTEVINNMLAEEDKEEAKEKGEALQQRVKHSLGSHLQPEACARSILAYFFMKQKSIPRPSRQKEHRVDRRENRLYKHYREVINVQRTWNVREMLMEFQKMPFLA